MFYVIDTATIDGKSAVKLLLKSTTGSNSVFGTDATYAASTIETAVGTWYTAWLGAGSDVASEDVVTGASLIAKSSGTPDLTDDTTAFLLSQTEATSLTEATTRAVGSVYWLRSSADADNAYNVGATGTVDNAAATGSNGVRPAVWLYLE